MTDNEEKTRGATIGELFALGVAFVVLGGVVLSLGSCGEDLILPGAAPPTQTAQFTATAEPTDTPIAAAQP